MSKSLELESLSSLIDQFVTTELGIRALFIKKILALGIDPKTNLAHYPRGMYATTFVVPDKKIVIKFFDKEPEEHDVAKLPNISRHALQAFCFTNILGNRLGIFPMLNTADVTQDHVDQLREGLEREGYIFDDHKLSNVGLTESNVPYVIDEDAVLIGRVALEPDPMWENQWQIIAPYFATDHKFNPMESGWKFDPAVLKNMIGIPSPSPTSPSSSIPPNATHL